MKKLLSVLMTLVLVGLTAVPLALPKLTAEAAEGFTVYYTYSDIQSEKNSSDLRYGTNSNHISWQQLPKSDSAHGIYAKSGYDNFGISYLAKNEREGMQIWYYQSSGSAMLSLSVSPFTDADGNVLSHEVFREEYVTPLRVAKTDPLLADPLIPYENGEAFETTEGTNETFYVEVRSTADQPSGTYFAEAVLSDGEIVIHKGLLAAYVWNFTLPAQHTTSAIMGLYNASSGYAGTCEFLKQNGVNVDSDGIIAAEDREKANEILEGWDEYLLDHGISPFELPVNLIEDDKKEAQLKMADIRRSNFFVPLLNLIPTASGSYDAPTLAVIHRYKDAVGNNSYLLNKAVINVRDEPDVLSSPAYIQSLYNAADSAWHGLNRMVTYNRLSGMDEALETLQPSENIVCMNTSFFSIAGSNSSAAAQHAFDRYTGEFGRKWRYHGDIRFGSFELYFSGKSTNGKLRRMVFWQQHAIGEDNYLYWNAAYLNSGWNVWEEMTLPPSQGLQTGNGNGLLLYPGLPLGFDPATPIGSLRIKQIASGMDDADYLSLAREFMSEEDYLTHLKRFFPYYGTDDYHRLFSAETDVGGPLWEVTTINGYRRTLGNALEQLNMEHEYGEWQTVVRPDHTHNGMEICACQNCGTEISRELPTLSQDSVIGDTNGDGRIDVIDATAVQRHAAGIEPLTGESQWLGDVTDDGSTDVIDTTQIQKYAAGLIDGF